MTAATKKKTSSGEHASTEELHALLVPLDLTPRSDRVLARLALLPLADSARVTLLHVVPDSLPISALRGAERDALKALTDEARHLRTLLHKKVTIKPLVRVGAAAKEIARCATEQDTDLIVMGRGGGRALRDAFLGSTAERVVRQAQLPVLVVRLAPRAAYHRPAIALDLEQAAHELLRLALLMLPVPRPRIDVIHAFDVPYQRLIYPSVSESDAEDRRHDLRSHATQRLAKLLASALAKANAPIGHGPFWKMHVVHGPPRTVIEKAIKKAETDLLVLGTHAYTGAAYMFLGTVAGDVLRAAKCDVLVVPPTRPGDESP